MRQSTARNIGWSAVVGSVVVLVLAAWFSTGLVLTARGNAAHAEGDLDAAERHHVAAADWLWVDRWLAPFNLGVVHHEQRRFGDAADDFQRAASLAPADQQCMVRLSWAHSLETAADSLVTASDVSSATAWYLNAQAVLANAVCTGDQEQQWDEARSRLEDKHRGDAPPADEPDPPTDPVAAQEEERERRERRAQEEFRTSKEDRERPEIGDGEKTW